MATITQIPGFKEAVFSEREQRQDAWLRLEEPLCGVAVKPLTLRMVLMLDLAQNWYVSGSPEALDVSSPEYLLDMVRMQGRFLWVCSPEFRPQDPAAETAFYKKLRKVDAMAMDLAIQKYYDAAFFDGPEGGAPNYTAPKTDWISVIVHDFAAAYGWAPDYTLDESLRILMQLHKCIRLSEDPKARGKYPNRLSDHVLIDELDRRAQARQSPTANGQEPIAS